MEHLLKHGLPKKGWPVPSTASGKIYNKPRLSINGKEMTPKEILLLTDFDKTKFPQIQKIEIKEESDRWDEFVLRSFSGSN